MAKCAWGQQAHGQVRTRPTGARFPLMTSSPPPAASPCLLLPLPAAQLPFFPQHPVITVIGFHHHQPPPPPSTTTVPCHRRFPPPPSLATDRLPRPCNFCPSPLPNPSSTASLVLTTDVPYHHLTPYIFLLFLNFFMCEPWLNKKILLFFKIFHGVVVAFV